MGTSTTTSWMVDNCIIHIAGLVAMETVVIPNWLLWKSLPWKLEHCTTVADIWTQNLDFVTMEIINILLVTMETRLRCYGNRCVAKGNVLL